MDAAQLVTVELWSIFAVIICVALSIDLAYDKIKSKIFKKQTTEQLISVRESFVWTIIWIGLAGIFSGLIWYMLGHGKFVDFVTGYVLEKSLSVDNMFVFLLIFTALAIPRVYQRTVLSLGIISAIAMRIGLILAGSTLIANFHWMTYVLAGILVFAAVRMIVQRNEKEINLEKNFSVKLLKKIMPISLNLSGFQFLIRKDGIRYATPLLVALVTIEFTDILFAMDSIPAILAITSDPFILITSNVFAIFGLRALYFLIAGMMEKFYYLKPGLIALLLFIGAKMFLSEIYAISNTVSLIVVFVILGIVIVFSLLKTRT